MVRLRKIVSLTAALSFLGLVLTSIVLYIVPQGRVAYWAGWKLWGLSKTQWTNLHINIGVLFILAALWHIYYNWKPMISYLKDASKKLRLFTPNFNIALVVVCVVILGTFFEIPPMSTVIEIGDRITQQANRKYGEPPYGHAELSSLKVFCKRVDLDLNSCMERLRKKGIKLEGEWQTIRDISRLNGMTPQALYELMKPEARKGTKMPVLPLKPAPGFAKRPLEDICLEYRLDAAKVLRILSEHGIVARREMDLKSIAERNKVSPQDVYYLIREASKQ